MSKNILSQKRIAVVTGSSKGIGRAIAITLAKSQNYSGIVTNARDIREAQTVTNEIKELGTCESIAIGADVSIEKDCIKLIEETVKTFQRIDLLVNNAGIQQDIPFADTTIEDWYKIIAVDLTGPFVCSREAVKQMKKQRPNGGCIINISSVHQLIPKPHFVPYATSKAGIEMMTKTLALEFATDKIRANLVAPGAIETDMNKEVIQNKADLEEVIKNIPIGRVGTAEEVAHVVEFLASDKASYVTGTTFYVDGGMTLYPSFKIYPHHR
jgi:glucose 1-dehydrogenase